MEHGVRVEEREFDEGVGGEKAGETTLDKQLTREKGQKNTREERWLKGRDYGKGFEA